MNLQVGLKGLWAGKVEGLAGLVVQRLGCPKCNNVGALRITDLYYVGGLLVMIIAKSTQNPILTIKVPILRMGAMC